MAAAVDALPEEGLPLPKPVIKNLLENVIKADIDTFDLNGDFGPDGVAESSSVALLFEGVPTTISGVEAPSSDAPATECASPPSALSFSKTIFHATTLQLGATGGAGQGLDVDGICLEPPSADICGG